MIANILVPLSLHYPQAGYSPAHLSALAEDWCEDLAQYSIDVVKAAVTRARRKEVFFPNVATITQYAQLVQREISSRVYMLQEVTANNENVRRSAICSAMLQRSLAGEPLAKEFFRTSDWGKKQALADVVLGAETGKCL